MFKTLSAETIINIVNISGGDGHSLFAPDDYKNAGMPEKLVEYFQTEFKSDGTAKGTIFVEGKPVKKLAGIYGLEVVEFIADAMELKVGNYFGRGFRAQAASSKILETLKHRGYTKDVCEALKNCPKISSLA